RAPAVARILLGDHVGEHGEDAAVVVLARGQGVTPGTARPPRASCIPRGMSYAVIDPRDQTWITRPHADGEPARHVTELSERSGMEHVRANVWRYEPGAAGRRHRHPTQDETFVVLSGTLSIYLGDAPERRDV